MDKVGIRLMCAVLLYSAHSKKALRNAGSDVYECCRYRRSAANVATVWLASG